MYGSAFQYGKCIFVFLSCPASSCGRKTHHQRSETLLCVFSFVSSNLNSVFHMTVQGIARGRVLGKLWFFVLLAGHISWEWLQLHCQQSGGRRCGAVKGCRRAEPCLVQLLWRPSSARRNSVSSSRPQTHFFCLVFPSPGVELFHICSVILLKNARLFFKCKPP